MPIQGAYNVDIRMTNKPTGQREEGITVVYHFGENSGAVVFYHYGCRTVRECQTPIPKGYTIPQLNDIVAKWLDHINRGELIPDSPKEWL